MANDMGDEERAAMYLQLEAIVKELKELTWKVDQLANFLSEFNLFLKGEAYDNALTLLEKPENKSLLNLQDTIELLHNVVSLKAKKTDLEKKLGTKVTLE